MSNNSFLVDYLNEAVKALKDMIPTGASAGDLQDALDPYVRKVIASIQDIQSALHQNLHSEKTLEYYENARNAMESLKTKVEEKLAAGELATEVKLAVKSRFVAAKTALTEFQRKLHDRANLDNVVLLLKGWKSTVMESQVVQCGIDSMPWTLYDQAVSQVEAFREKIKENGVEGLKEPFCVAYASVKEFASQTKNTLQEKLDDEELRARLMQPIDTCVQTMHSFQERLSKTSALEYASTSLEEVRVQLSFFIEQQRTRVAESETIQKSWAQVQEVVVACQTKLATYTENVSLGNAEYVGEAYAQVKESLGKLANMEYSEALASQKDYVLEKVKFVQSVIESTAQTTASTLSQINLATAKEVIKSVEIAYNTDKLAKLKEILAQIQEMERVQNAQEKVKELYDSAISKVNSITVDLEGSIDPTKKLVVGYLSKARESLALAKQANEVSALVQKGYIGVLSTAVMVDRRLQLLELGKFLWEKTKTFDENRLSGALQNKILPGALEKAEGLDARFTNGKVGSMLTTAKTDFQERRDVVVASADGTQQSLQPYASG